VLAEAMACGVPVVGSSAGSIPEVIEDGRTGLLATPLDPVSFADQIKKLAREFELRRKMGKHAVERVEKHFSVGRAVEETIRIYDRLI
jgi:glycosyltransferase involved in cell wall biosynthesis